MTSIYQKLAVATFGTCLSLAALDANSVQATTLAYNEAVDGDLPVLASESPMFALGLGTNTFTGEQTFSNGVPDTDFDSFAFSLPAGTRLESILVDISLLPGGSGIFNSTGYIFQNAASLTNIAPEQAIAIPSTNLSLFASALPLESGQFALQHGFVSGGLNPGEFQTAAYTFSINVTGTEVPEPSTLAGLACLGLGSLLLKKKTATLR